MIKPKNNLKYPQPIKVPHAFVSYNRKHIVEKKVDMESC